LSGLKEIPSVEFQDVVIKCEKEFGIVNLVYNKCIEEFQNIERLSQLKLQQERRIIKTFLISWGRLGRCLGKEGAGVKKIGQTLRNHQTTEMIETVRNEKLLTTKLEDFEGVIIELYETLRTAKTSKRKKVDINLGHVGASKILHLACPDFFPPWDNSIRKTCEFSEKPEDYYKFIKSVQKIWKDLEPVIGKLIHRSEDSRRYSIGIIDEYLWTKSRKTDKEEKQK